ncbi:MAG: hypothetical protein DSZ24_03400, partial [Thermodesulfatator sp.]
MKVFGVIGYPVRHSLSPAMHNAAFQALGISAVYGAFEVPPPLLAEALSGVKALGIGGLSVTVPHKETVMAHLDENYQRFRALVAGLTEEQMSKPVTAPNPENFFPALTLLELVE